MRDKGMTVVAGEVKSEVDRPAAPGKGKKKTSGEGVTSPLCLSSGTLKFIG